jgi:hypothetical protein
MRTLRLLSPHARPGPVRVLLAVCLLVAGFSSPGICIEPDGAAHVSRADHFCCDPPAADPGRPGDAHGNGDSTSFHDCAHAPLGPSSSAPEKSRSSRAAAAVRIGVTPETAPGPEAIAFRPDGSSGSPRDLAFLSTVLLRL